MCDSIVPQPVAEWHELGQWVVTQYLDYICNKQVMLSVEQIIEVEQRIIKQWIHSVLSVTTHPSEYEEHKVSLEMLCEP